uniref:Predicted gene, 26657 n=1 Tax=Peromyscus maniculatus bairdii TaxID=230844 RepID=A0A8C8UKP8_PERMB
VHGGDAKGLEHELRVLFPVAAGAERRVGHQHRVLFREDLHGGVEDVLPDVLDAIPVHHNAVLQWVNQLQRCLHVEQLMAHVSLLEGVSSVCCQLRAALAHGRGDEVGGPWLSGVATLAVLGTQVNDQ